MFTTPAPALPRRRCVEAVNSSQQPDVTEAEAEAIMGAVYRGKRLDVRTDGDDSHHILLGGPLREVCLTEYTDPASGQIRYAVETWAGPRKVTHDFADPADAQTRYHNASANLDLA